MDGYYYLHTNGDLIFKKFEPEIDSTFVRKIWPIDLTNRMHAWRKVVESLALNANVERVKELASKWECDLKDAVEYLGNENNPTKLRKNGFEKYLTEIAGVDYDSWFDWLVKTPIGKEPDLNSMPTGKP